MYAPYVADFVAHDGSTRGSMRALRFRTHWTVDLTDEPEPQPAAGKVILEVDAVGICGSDVHGFAVTDRRKPGVVMRHEIGGRIVAGPAVAR
jgi:threonine dehydrogenase-like Zn-dependent dehydrogenase